jgi:hypothetical protein
MKTLRTFLKVSSLLALCGAVPAYASAPMIKTQPGFYRMMLGDFEVTALNDGVVAYPVSRVCRRQRQRRSKEQCGQRRDGIASIKGVRTNS